MKQTGKATLQKGSRQGDADGIGSFHQEVGEILQALSGALGEVVRRVSPDIQKPGDLQRALRLDSKLCWQVFNVIRKADSLATAQHVPGVPSARRLLAAATEAGVSDAVVGAARALFDRFNAMVTEHGPDRASFDSLAIAASPASDSATTDLMHRRSAYRSESHLWGVQVDRFIGTSLIHPAATGEGKDECELAVRVGQRRLRCDAPVMVHGVSKFTPPDSPQALRAPLDPEASERLNAPLLPRFCSDPLPPMQTVQRATGFAVEVQGDFVGRKAAFDLAFGSVMRNTPYVRDAQDRRLLRHSVSFVTPAGQVCLDTFIHRDLAGTSLEPKAYVTAPPSIREMAASPAEARRFPVEVAVQRIHVDSPDVAISEYSHYVELLRFAAESQGWDLSAFSLYRARLMFPILHTVLHVDFALD